MARYPFQGSFKDFSGNVVSEGTISVFTASSTVLATIYSTTGSSAITGSAVTSSTDGDFNFWVDQSDYATTQRFKLELSKVDFTTNTYDDVKIFDDITASSTTTFTNKTFQDTLICSSDLQITGNTSSSGKLTIQNLITGSSQLAITNAITASSALTVINTITGSSDLIIDGNITSSGTLTVQNTVTCSSGLAPNHIFGTVGSSSGTFVRPIISDFTSMNHSHASSSQAGVIVGTVRQVVNAMFSASSTGDTPIPHDDTIPQITEGDEYMTLAITPNSATNQLEIKTVSHYACSAANDSTIALFQDATANALAAVSENISGANQNRTVAFTHYMTAGTTSATTFRIRIGMSTTDITTFNGQAGVRLFGGVSASSMTITEIQA